MSNAKKHKAAVTLGQLLAEVGLDDPDMRLDSPDFEKRMVALLGSKPDDAVLVPSAAGPRVRTAEEQATIDRVKARQNERPDLPKWTLRPKRSGGVEAQPEDQDEELARAQTMEALGLVSLSSLSAMLDSVVGSATRNGVVEQDRFNSLLELVASVRPRDELEANLALEMALVHTALNHMAYALSNNDMLPQQDAAVNALNKLARTRSLQLETLKRLRSTGQQQIVIKRIEVKEGGRAVVGTVNNGSDREVTLQHEADEPGGERLRDQRKIATPTTSERPLPFEIEPSDPAEPGVASGATGKTDVKRYRLISRPDIPTI